MWVLRRSRATSREGRCDLSDQADRRERVYVRFGLDRLLGDERGDRLRPSLQELGRGVDGDAEQEPGVLISPPKHVNYGFAKIWVSAATTSRESPRLRSSRRSSRRCRSTPSPDATTDRRHCSSRTTATPPISSTCSQGEPNPANTNTATLTSVTPNFYPAGTLTGTFQPIDIAGTNLSGVTEVGFFESGNAVTDRPGDHGRVHDHGAGTSIQLTTFPTRPVGSLACSSFGTSG